MADLKTYIPQSDKVPTNIAETELKLKLLNRELSSGTFIK